LGLTFLLLEQARRLMTRTDPSDRIRQRCGSIGWAGWLSADLLTPVPGVRMAGEPDR